MIFYCCLDCEHHKVDERNDCGHCEKENCYSVHSTCIVNKALEEFEKTQEVKSIHLINKAKHGRT